MPVDMYDTLNALAKVWNNLTKEQQDTISEMIASARVEPAPVCNLCGRLLDEWDMQEDFTIHTNVGYGSKHDMEEIKLRICCDCFDKLVDSCAVSPIVED